MATIWAAVDLFGACSNEAFQTAKAWDAVGVSGTMGLGYDLNVTCADILNGLNQGGSYTARAIHNITSNCNIGAINQFNSPVTFVAGNQIVLLPGFRSGNNFHAYIEPCFSQLGKIKKDSDNFRYYQQNHNEIKREIYDKYDKRDNGKAFEDVKIYPNPFETRISIKTEQVCYYVIYDSKGSVVHKGVLSEGLHTINLAYLPRGHYFIKLNKE